MSTPVVQQIIAPAGGNQCPQKSESFDSNRRLAENENTTQEDGYCIHGKVDVQGHRAIENRSCPFWKVDFIGKGASAVDDSSPGHPNDYRDSRHNHYRKHPYS